MKQHDFTFLSDVFAAIAVVVAIVLIGTLRDCDGDGNENVKNTIGKSTTLHGHHAFFFFFFFYISLLPLHNYGVK